MMSENSKMQTFFTKRSNIILCAIICTFLWGSAFPSVKIGYELFSIASEDAFSKLVYAGLRFSIAGLMTLLISMFLNKKLCFPRKNAISAMLALAVIQTFLQYVFYYLGLANTTGVKGAILSSTNAIFIVLLAHFFCKGEKITKKKLFGCAIGFVGVLLVNLSSGSLDLSFSFSGDGYIVLSALFFAIGSVISKHLPQDADSTSITGWQLLIGGLLLLLVGYLGGGGILHVTLSGVLLLLYSAFISAAAFTLWLFLMRYNPAGKIAIYSFLTPIFGTTLSGIFLGEEFLTWNNALALLCVCLGIYFVNAVPHALGAAKKQDVPKEDTCNPSKTPQA